MKYLRFLGTILVFIVGISLVARIPLSAQEQEPTVIQPPHGNEVATVVVRVWTHFDNMRHNPDRDMHVTKAVGFTADNGSCDIVTTWTVVNEYEQRQNRPNVREEIAVTIAGETYAGSLRPMGFNVMNLGLACVDLLPPASNEHLTMFPLPLERSAPLSVWYEVSLSEMIPGMPFLNKKGRVVGVFLGMFADEDKCSPGFVSAEALHGFLTLASDFPRSEPMLRLRSSAGQ